MQVGLENLDEFGLSGSGSGLSEVYLFSFHICTQLGLHAPHQNLIIPKVKSLYCPCTSYTFLSSNVLKKTCSRAT